MSKKNRGGKRPANWPTPKKKTSEVFDQEKVEQAAAEPSADEQVTEPEPETAGPAEPDHAEDDPNVASDETEESFSETDTETDDASDAPVATAAAPDEASGSAKGSGSEEPEPWRRFAFGGPRTSVGALVAALLALGLGFAVMTQVRQNERSGLDNLSQADLVALLANVNDQSDRLGNELDDLRTTKQKLASGGDSAAVADAQKRLDQLAILNGTSPVKGPGIVIDVQGSGNKVSAANILDAVQELRDSGAESIDVGGQRVVAATWFDDRGGHPSVEGRALPDHFQIKAIGDPHTMSTAMAIPGGVTDTLTQAGAHVKVTEDSAIKITSVRPSK